MFMNTLLVFYRLLHPISAYLYQNNSGDNSAVADTAAHTKYSCFCWCLHCHLRWVVTFLISPCRFDGMYSIQN